MQRLSCPFWVACVGVVILGCGFGQSFLGPEAGQEALIGSWYRIYSVGWDTNTDVLTFSENGEYRVRRASRDLTTNIPTAKMGDYTTAGDRITVVATDVTLDTLLSVGASYTCTFKISTDRETLVLSGLYHGRWPQVMLPPGEYRNSRRSSL